MFSETYPITKSWLREDDVNFINSTLAPRKFNAVYIGREASFQMYFSANYNNTTKVDDFESAKSLIESHVSKSNNLPDAILVDISLDKKQYKEFCNYLKQTGKFATLPILYNKQRLSTEEISYLLKSEIVDDIIDLSENKIDYTGKITFLKKVKKFSGPLQVNKTTSTDPINKRSDLSMISKRIFDIIISSILIICSLPIFLLIALAIKLESRGPVFYTSLRAGKGFKIFPFYKFRTMEVDADKKIDSLNHLNKYEENNNGARFLKIYNDPRVTRVGRLLRKTSLDELPQLYNVLKGDMSLVGNRPLPIYEATTLTTNEFAERFMAPAGITGLWQIMKKNNPDMSAEERINLDISYARNYSFLNDIKIIAKTPSALFQKNHL